MAKPIARPFVSVLQLTPLFLLFLLLATCSDESTTSLPFEPSYAELEGPGTVGDRVWEDMNANGVQDSGEEGLKGIEVYLWSGGDKIQNVETGENGEYLFEGLEPGVTYEVEFLKPGGYRFSPQNAGTDPAADSDADPLTGRVSVALAGGETDKTVDAGIYPLGSVTGLVWDDLDHDGIQDEGEPPLEGIEVRLLFGHHGSILKETGPDGVYRFDELIPSAGPHGATWYRLHFALPDDDHLFSPRDRGGDDTADSDVSEEGQVGPFMVTPGQGLEAVDAGMFHARPSVGDRVWNDRNKNGIQDEGEPGIEGVTVYLFELWHFGDRHEATTDSEGGYLFDDLRWSDPEPHGEQWPYQLQFVLPDESWFSPRGEGDEGAVDSDASPTDGKTSVFFVYPGQHRTDLDAGMFDAWADLRGQVWNDVNVDGIQDPGEDGIIGVTVVLEEYRSGGDTDHTTTDHNEWQLRLQQPPMDRTRGGSPPVQVDLRPGGGPRLQPAARG
jgi:hypothetical protein